MRRFVLAALLICCAAQPLPACINDSATQVDEQQFVSGYDERGQPRARSPVGVKISTFNPTALLLLVPSLALVGVAFLWMRQEKVLANRQPSVARSNRA
jgi:hypothetical protein